MKKIYESPQVEVTEMDVVVLQSASDTLPISDETTQTVDSRDLMLFDMMNE